MRGGVELGRSPTSRRGPRTVRLSPLPCPQGFCTCCFLLSCPPWAASAVAAEAEAELEPDHVLGTELVSVRGGNKAPAEAMATPPGQAACARGP